MNPFSGTSSVTTATVATAAAFDEETLLQDAEELIMEGAGDLLLVRGDIDLYVAPQFQERATAHIRAAAQPRLDLNGVPFLDSAGLAVLVSLVREAQAGGKTLRVSASGSPRRVLRITGIDHMMTMDE